MKQNPERVAWVVILLAFMTFCVVIVAVPLGVRAYLLYATREHKASVESLVGTVVVEPPVGRGPIPLGKGQSMTIPEGTVIRVDETSEATVTLFDHSFMRLFSGTTLRLDQSRAPRYAMSRLPNTLRFTLLGGQLTIGTAMSPERKLDFQVKTLQADVRLEADGSYALEANNARSEVIAYRGGASVTGMDQQVQLEAPQRTEIALNQPPQPPTGVARNLVANGVFEEPLEPNWRVFNDQGNDGGDVDGRAEVVVDEGRRAVRFSRVNGHGNHCETILEQNMDRKLPDQATSLVVRATVKVNYQSLSGGGYLSSEYPLMIRLTYRDVYDSETEWVEGFYYENSANNPTPYGQQIPQNRWYLFESENLLDSLPIRPFRLIRLQVYASGWDYESLISDINLVVE